MAEVAAENRPKAERLHWIENVDDPGEGSIEIRLVQIMHDGSGNRLAEGTMGVQFTVERGGVSVVYVAPLVSLGVDIAETIQARATGDRERPAVEKWVSFSRKNAPWL